VKQDIRVYLEDILESIGIIEEYTQELSAEDFFHRRQTQDAVIRRLEIIGELVTAYTIRHKLGGGLCSDWQTKKLPCRYATFK
jgi:uncharacterized protein with HEPN domain